MNTVAQLPDDDKKDQEIINIADADVAAVDLNQSDAVSIDDQPIVEKHLEDNDQVLVDKIIDDAVEKDDTPDNKAKDAKKVSSAKSSKPSLPKVEPIQIRPQTSYLANENITEPPRPSTNDSVSTARPVSANGTSAATQQITTQTYSDHLKMSTGRSATNRTASTARVTSTPLNLNRMNTSRVQADSSKLVPISGVLDLSLQGHGVIRVGYSEDDNDAYISTALIRRYGLLQGDIVTGTAREPKENDRYYGFAQIEKINDVPLADWGKTIRQKFHRFTPVYPNDQIKLEIGEEPMSLRIIDLIAPIGKGQRSLIVSPPKAGKTVLLKDIATGIARNHPDIHLMAVLVGERPEEVTDIRRHIESITGGKGEVAASNFDEHAKDQCRVAELALERAKRLVELGGDVVILLDSITRLARAYNLAMPTSGRTLSGGFDPAALFPPKKFFGAARNFEVQGSLTIVGTALVETGSRMDDLIYEEFKGTGNQEVQLVRRLAERRIYPAIEVQKSGTRRDDLLMDSMTYQSIITLQRMLDMIDANDRTTTLIDQLKKFKSNKEFLASLKQG